MREGTCSFSAPEAIIQDCATSQICRRWFGVDARMSNGYVDAKVPGAADVCEKLFKAWWSHQFLGMRRVRRAGSCTQARPSRPAQALLDWDMWESLGALFAKEPEPEDEIPFGDIHDVASAQGSFLGTAHTMRLFREVLRHPVLLDRSPRRSTKRRSASPPASSTAPRGATRSSAAPRLSTMPRTTSHALDEVVERAKRDLL